MLGNPFSSKDCESDNIFSLASRSVLLRINNNPEIKYDNSLIGTQRNLIKVYEDSNKLNFAISRQSMGKEKVKQDNNLVFVTSKQHIKDEIFFEQIQPSIQEFCNLAWASYAEYTTKYGVLNNLASHRFYDSIKIQKTKPTFPRKTQIIKPNFCH